MIEPYPNYKGIAGMTGIKIRLLFQWVSLKRNFDRVILHSNKNSLSPSSRGRCAGVPDAVVVAVVAPSIFANSISICVVSSLLIATRQRSSRIFSACKSIKLASKGRYSKKVFVVTGRFAFYSKMLGSNSTNCVTAK